jgi:hypothetical protein
VARERFAAARAQRGPRGEGFVDADADVGVEFALLQVWQGLVGFREPVDANFGLDRNLAGDSQEFAAVLAGSCSNIAISPPTAGQRIYDLSSNRRLPTTACPIPVVCV